MRPPSRRQARRCARWKAGVIEDEFCVGSPFDELEPHDRIDARRPILFSPRLHDSLMRNQFDVPAQNLASKNGERPAYFRADLGRSALIMKSVTWLNCFSWVSAS